jgi:hypothetical protein
VTVPEAFDIYRGRLEITQTEQDDAARRQKDVRASIQEKFDIERDFLTGSYGRHTKTKPLQDVDIFFVLGAGEKHRREEDPGRVLDAFEECLTAAYGREQVDRDRRCLTVYFEKRNQTQHPEGKILSVDVVPAFSAGKHYEMPDTTLGKWIKTDPEIHAEKTTKKNDKLDGNWVPLVKMLKAWNRSAEKPIKPSFLVEVMALQLVDPPFNNYPDEARRFFAAAAAQIHDTWPDPAGLGPVVSDQMTPALCSAAEVKLRSAEVLAARAYRAEQQGHQGEALALWKNIFGDYFPST